MIKYKTKVTRYKTLGEITCDKCNKTFKLPVDEMEIQEFHHVNFIGGYESIFGDESTVGGDFCQRCLRDLLGKYLYVNGIKEKD